MEEIEIESEINKKLTKANLEYTNKKMKIVKSKDCTIEDKLKQIDEIYEIYRLKVKSIVGVQSKKKKIPSKRKIDKYKFSQSYINRVK